MTVHDPDSLDSLALDPDRGEVILGIVVPGPLKGSRRLADELVKKVNAYLAFLAGGELEKQHPQTRGLPKTIEITHQGKPDRSATTILAQVEAQLRAQHVGLRLRANA